MKQSIAGREKILFEKTFNALQSLIPALIQDDRTENCLKGIAMELISGIVLYRRQRVVRSHPNQLVNSQHASYLAHTLVSNHPVYYQSNFPFPTAIEFFVQVLHYEEPQNCIAKQFHAFTTTGVRLDVEISVAGCQSLANNIRVSK